MKFITYVLVFVVILFVAIAGVYGLFSSRASAKVLVKSGSVQVDSGSGYESVSNELKLKQDYKVKNIDGDAAIVIFDSIIVDLQKGSEVVVSDLVKDNIKLFQAKGSTWNKFMKLAGIGSFQISTPKSVATVRGTEFGVSEDEVLVADGIVDVSFGSSSVSLFALQKSQIRDGVVVAVGLTEEDKLKVLSNMKKMLEVMRYVREIEIGRHTIIVGIVKKQYGWSDEDVKNKLKELDENNEDLDTLAEKLPFKVKSVEIAKDMTNEIRKQVKLIKDFESS